MLSKTSTAAEFDSVHMGHFESAISGKAPLDYWSVPVDSTSAVSVVDSGVATFGKVLNVATDLTEYGFITQTVYKASDTLLAAYNAGTYSETAPMTYMVSGWGKGTAQCYAGTSQFEIEVTVTYSNGRNQYEVFCFDKGITDWQFVSGAFRTQPSYGMVKEITVSCQYNDHSGEAFFDNISVVRESSAATFYDYNSRGYLVGNQDSSVTTGCTYDPDTDNLTSVTYSDGRTISYTYDAYNRVKTEKHSRAGDAYQYTYTYNNYGQLLSTDVYDFSTLQHMVTSATYNTSSSSHIFGTLATETDALGQVTRYFYNSSTGELLATVYPEGNGTTYSYDAIGNLTSARPVSSSTSSGYTTDYNSSAVLYDYDSANRLSTITTRQRSSETTTYSFSYDGFGNTTSIDVGDYGLADYSYNSYNGKLSSMTYGNGLTVSYTYDALDRVTQIRYNGSVRYSYAYTTDGNLHSATDHTTNTVTVYKYDSEGKVIRSYQYDATTYENQYGSQIFYDADSRVTLILEDYGYSYSGGTANDDARYSYSYNSVTGYLASFGMASDYLSGAITPTYDNLGRTQNKIIDFNVNGSDAFYNKLTYGYTWNADCVSPQVSTVTSEVRKGASTEVVSADTYTYTYDENGNITRIVGGNNFETRYVYDSLGQLIREDNAAKVSTYVYTYDNNGNILSRTTYLYTGADVTPTNPQSTDIYTYGDATWGDLLTAYNGTSITYDGVGNPLTIGSASLTWQGRQLMQYVNGSNTYAYTYNEDGIRTSKTVNGVRHDYLLDGTRIIKETVSSAGVEQYALIYLYDETGAPVGMKYRTPSYAENVFDCFFFEKNLQGDIVAVYDSNGTEIATYVYTAWGECTMSYYSSTANSPGLKNPFKYRGYYHDSETGWYYLQSRYYNSTWGRFINADEYINANGDIIGYNLFAYCSNNPIMYSDPTGEIAKWIIAVVVVVVVVVVINVVAECNMPTQEEHYNRNSNNTIEMPPTIDGVPDDWRTSDENDQTRERGPADNAHQFSSPDRSNIKVVSPDGRMEAIYDSKGNLVTDPRDIGTYNFCPSGNIFQSIGHYVKDVKPWIRWGNTPDDTTTPWQRMWGLLGIYG
jgi:RHS repeat-associated protein